MRKKLGCSAERKIIIACLIVAALGVIIQIISGHPYPKVPPVFFILLIPAALLFFTSSRWAPVSSVLSCVFLTAGLFLSGAVHRLVDLKNPGDSAGLWIQSVAVFAALVAGSMVTYKNFTDHRKMMDL